MSVELRLERLALNLRRLSEALVQAVRERSDLESEMTGLRQELLAARRQLRETENAPAAAAPAQTAAAPAKRGRAAVVSWDLAHNPAGRAFVLHELLSQDWETDLVGPLWRRFGGTMWPPLDGMAENVRAFPASDFFDFFPKALLAATTQRYDLVCVVKPRFPSLFLGYLIAEFSDCPLILDIDEHELAFGQNRDPATLEELKAAGDAPFIEPYEELLTRFCETLIGEADAITVSNTALQARFGGHIVRHARDEQVFAPNIFDAGEVRQQLGIAEDEFALGFAGTPRRHKGLFAVAQALHEIADPKISLNVFGAAQDRRLKRELERYSRANVRIHGDVHFSDLPRTLSAVDAVPLIQDPADPMSEYQIPAKISDATALGKPVLATNTPAMRDLVGRGPIIEVEAANLAKAILALKACKDAGELAAGPARDMFLDEFSYKVNRARLDNAVEAARTRRRGHPGMSALKDYAGEVFARRVARTAAIPTPAIVSGKDQLPDIAFFWKQNDTGIFGRRSDMVVKYLVESGRVGRVILFDAPINGTELVTNLGEGSLKTGEPSFQLRNSLARWMKGLDTSRLQQRLYISATADVPSLFGRTLPPAEDYPTWVAEQIADAGMDPRRTIAWDCPVVWDYPEIAERIPFLMRVVDIIDDQRAWNVTPKYKEKLEENYAASLATADIVFANCAPVANAFAPLAPDIHTIRNGAELFDLSGESIIPERLAMLPRPIIGYAGNLRDRIDWGLLAETVKARPEWSFVLLGSAQSNARARDLDTFPNVHFLGVVEYSQIVDYLRAFDVAIVPHERNKLTQHMNPLKVYNYFSAGLPIVMTGVANLEEMEPHVRVASDAKNFLAQIENALLDPPTPSEQRQRMMSEISWRARVAGMIDVIEHQLAKKPEWQARQPA